MAVQKILTLPNPILRQKSKVVAKIDQKTLEILNDIKETLLAAENPKGVGLAAPQIGQSLRIILIWSSGSRRFLPMINPQIVWHSLRTRLGIKDSKKSLQAYEGCLSVPGVWGKVRRFSVIKVRWQTPNGQMVIRKFRGLTSVVVQHEVDHLDGILFVDRVLEQKARLPSLGAKATSGQGELYKIEKDPQGKPTLVEVKLKR